MSRAVRKQLFEVLDTLLEASFVLESMCDDGNEEQFLNVLADCQECAITIGDKIDIVYGEGKDSVYELEGYCEKLYLISQSVENSSQRTELCKSAMVQLEQIKDLMVRELPDKREILFLPYKASMWDSMESVYLAACEDKTCDAYVMPIPYYDKNSDKSFCEMHYEGELFPSNIPITDYNTYDVAERRPDIIYIHNPYDEYNLVTSVHPAFYSSKLKELTEQLVYIPYFVLGEIDSKSTTVLETIKKFAVVPGVVNAHKVILESKEMKKAYVAVLVEEFGENTRMHWERKVEGIGSPKYDKIAKTKRADVEIPAEWNKILKREDGNLKKVILYNTSVNALLANDEKMLEKMQDVFQFFKENREHVALLWRPHPLIKATIESLRPKMWEEYSKLVENYREEGWGIYDDTTDLDRAIVLSDAYYGDWSSVIALCQQISRPIMVQRPCKIDEKKTYNAILGSRAVCISKQDYCLWMVTAFTSCLLKIDLKTGMVMEVYSLPVDEIKNYAVIDMKCFDDFIYMVPYNSDKLICFSIGEGKFIQMELPITEEEKKQPKKFSKILNHNSSLYFIGQNINVIIKYDLQTQHMKRIDGFSDIKNWMAVDAIVVGDKLYVPLVGENAVIRLSTKDDAWEKIVIQNGISDGFEVIAENEGTLILTDKKGNIIFYNLENMNVETKNLEGQFNGSQRYRKIVCYKGKEFYLPNRNEEIKVRDEEGNVRKLSYNYPLLECFNAIEYMKFQMILAYDNLILFQARTTGDVFEINMDTEEIQIFEIHLSDVLKEKILEFSFYNAYKNTFNEDSVYTLEDFCRYIKKEQRDDTDSTCLRYGEQIYKKLLGD